MPSVDGPNLYIINLQLLVETESMKVCDMSPVKFVMDIPSLTSRLLETLVTESSRMVAMRVRYERACLLGNLPRGRRINDKRQVWSVQEESVEPAYSIFSNWPFPQELFLTVELRRGVGKSLPSTPYLQPVVSGSQRLI